MRRRSSTKPSTTHSASRMRPQVSRIRLKSSTGWDMRIRDVSANPSSSSRRRRRRASTSWRSSICRRSIRLARRSSRFRSSKTTATSGAAEPADLGASSAVARTRLTRTTPRIKGSAVRLVPVLSKRIQRSSLVRRCNASVRDAPGRSRTSAWASRHAAWSSGWMKSNASRPTSSSGTQPVAGVTAGLTCRQMPSRSMTT